VIGLRTPFAVVCHDAGAANLILPWIAADRSVRLLPAMAGPAESLWRARFPAIATLPVREAVSQASAVLTGTGWASDLEHLARRMARSLRLPTVAVIDHWVNYRERFRRDGEEVLPDEIWVTDDHALAIAREEFGGIPVRLKPNLYLEEQLASAPPLDEADQDVLFVGEPVRADWGRGTSGEVQAFDHFMTHRTELGIPPRASIRVRRHPADPPEKYVALIGRHPGVRLDRSRDFASALAGVRWVVGLESYALVVALRAGRIAISALPPWAPPCRLPHREIIRLTTL